MSSMGRRQFAEGWQERHTECVTTYSELKPIADSLSSTLSPAQVEGAFVQGLGLFTMEEVRYSQSGFPWTTGPGAYKIPGFQDIPVEFYVHLLRSAPNEKAIFSSKVIALARVTHLVI